jgi:RNA polymerase sigma factor (sigma-70 family)
MHHPAITDASVAVARRDVVEDVLRTLDPDGRAIVVLHYYLGMPLPDVAATLRIPVGTVKSRLHRALGQMRIAISDVPDEPQREPVAGGQLA